MTILISFVFFNFSKKKIGFYKLLVCSFYFNSIPRIFNLIHQIPTPIPHILTMIHRIPTPIPRIPTEIPRIPTPIPCISTPPPAIPRILLIPFPDSTSRLLKIDLLTMTLAIYIKERHSAPLPVVYQDSIRLRFICQVNLFK